MWYRHLAWVLASLLLVGCDSGRLRQGGHEPQSGPAHEPQSGLAPAGWELIWADEFNGDRLDGDKWNVQTGDGTAEGIPGWGNNELQSYRRGNVSVRGGNLVITVRAEAADDSNYTSGRINTNGKLAFRYGRVEANIRVPAGQGLWSAFWLLPTDSPYGAWAASGEIDIMEVFSRQPAPFTQGALHYGMAWPLNVYVTRRHFGVDPADGFHTYALEWDDAELRWFVDGVHFYTVRRSTYWAYYKDPVTNAHRSGGDSAPFDQPFHLLLNVAVGGNLPGDPVALALPAEMLVDYVRVYRCTGGAAAGTACGGLADAVDRSVAGAAPGDVFRAEYALYDDRPGPLAFKDIDEPLALEFGVHDSDRTFALTEVDGGERGTVIDVYSSGNGSVSIMPVDLSRLRFLGMGSAEDAISLAGELQFDLYVFSADTDAEGALRIKLDSGSPAPGFVELPLADLPTDEWATITVQISDIAHSAGNSSGDALDLNQVVGLFVLEPTDAAHLRVDNIKVVCGHPQANGCGIAPAALPVHDES